MEQFIITAEEKNSRLDKVVPSRQPDWSRTQVQQWIKEGDLLVNNQQVKSNYKVAEGDVITIQIPEPVELDVVAEDLQLEIIYEDKDLLIVNKPSGMVVHPSAGHASGTLVNGLMHQVKDLSGINGVLRPGIVHRLDKDTSGLLVVAKNDSSHIDLVNQLVERTVTRKYIAVVHGRIPHEKGTIEAPIGRNPKDRQSMDVVGNGKEAITHFRVLEHFGDRFTLVECQLETGRTHQIRVHMKYIGHPIAADPVYGPRKTLEHDGQLLHARTLGLIHPSTGEYIEYSQEVPADFQEVLQQLRAETN